MMNNNFEVIRVSKANDICDNACDCTHLPDACTNDVREENLMKRQAKNDGRSKIRRVLERDRNLIFACLVLVIALNTKEGRYVLYPFRIFETWVHEMCHGLAAILMGGRCKKLLIFKDGGGLAYTAVSGTNRAAIVSSAGYTGTAILGCLLLLFRRTTLGPTIGTIGLGFCLLLSCAVWVRNGFGAIVLSIEGVVLALLGWKLPAVWLDNLFNFLAATCSMNAVDSIQDLFASSYYVNSEEVQTTDAHSVANKWGLTYIFWATLWLWFSIIMTAVGIICAFDAREVPACLKDNTVNTTTSSAPPASISILGTGYTGASAPLMEEGTPASAKSNNNNSNSNHRTINPSFASMVNNDAHYYQQMAASPKSNNNTKATTGTDPPTSTKRKVSRWSPHRFFPGRGGSNNRGGNGNANNSSSEQVPAAWAIPM